MLCKESLCKFDCIANLTSALTLYLDELSRVLFKKENMRDKSWWLSAFYSLCIQSKVRKCLINLVADEPTSKKALGANKYLHLAVRLFIGSSGAHDPLVQSFSSESNASDYELAQRAIQQENWKMHGIGSSAEYLNQLFEDDGEIPDIGNANENSNNSTQNLRTTEEEFERNYKYKVVSAY